MNGQKFARFIKRNGANILTIAAVGGVVGTGITAYRAGEMRDCHEEGIREHDYARRRNIAIGTGLGTAACIIGARYLGAKREAALLAAGTVVAQSLAVAQHRESDDQKQEYYIPIRDVEAEETGHGHTLFIEEWTGRRFYSSKDDVEYGINAFMRKMLQEGDQPLNALYNFWDIKKTLAGEILGWNQDQISPYRFDHDDNCIYDERYKDLKIFLDEKDDGSYVIKYPVAPMMDYLTSNYIKSCYLE